MPKVIVVSCYYNRDEYVDRTVESIIQQDFRDFQLVIVDDGSTDRTLERMRRYESDLVTVRTHANMGFTASMVDAIRSTDSEYIAVCGSGDEALPERLRVQSEFLDSNPDVAVVGCETVQVGVDGYRSKGVSLEGVADPYAELLKRSIFGHSDVMFRRSMYDRVGGYRPLFKYSQDNDLWLRMARVGALAQVPQMLQKIYKMDDGVTVKPRTLIQSKIYRRLAVYCALERDAGRVDPVDEYGEAAFAMVPPSRELGQRFIRDGVSFLVRNRPAEARQMFAAAQQQGMGALGRTLSALTHIPWIFSVLPVLRNARRSLRERRARVAV